MRKYKKGDTMKRLTIFTFITIGILIASCAGPRGLGPTPPNVNTFHSKMTHEVLKIEKSYERIMISLGRAEAQGLVSAERVRQIRDIADKVYDAIEQAKASLSTFIATGGSKDLVTSSMATLIELMSDLLASELDLQTMTNINQFRAMGGYPVAYCPNF